MEGGWRDASRMGRARLAPEVGRREAGPKRARARPPLRSSRRITLLDQGCGARRWRRAEEKRRQRRRLP